MTWNIEDFKGLVKACYGEEQVQKLDRLLRSVYWKKLLAQYHAEESIKLYRSFLSEKSVEGSEEELIQVIGHVIKAASGSEKERKFLIARITSEAHLIAFAQSLHSIADILAKVIYIGLNLDINLTVSIPENERNSYGVNKEMRENNYALNVVEAVDAFLLGQTASATVDASLRITNQVP